MINIEKLVRELTESEYDALCDNFESSRADKLLFLLNLLRTDNLKDDQILKRLKISLSAFYTLKSRLYDKIQESLTKDTTDIKARLLVAVSNIPDLIFDVPRETAIAMLKKLEGDLIRNDLPHELRGVYNALKKLHFNTPKYFEYSQQYNKHLAYIIALDKSEELILSFHKMLGDYLLSRDKNLIEVLHILKKEMSSLAQLYQSHHLDTYKMLVDISFALYVPIASEMMDDLPVEDLLVKLEKNLARHPEDKSYKHIQTIFHFLGFEYYLSIRQYKKAEPHFIHVNEILPKFLTFNFYCFPSKFLLSKLKYYSALKRENKLSAETAAQFKHADFVTYDTATSINFAKYSAAVALYDKNYEGAIQGLNNFLNKERFLNCAHSEMEMKLLLAYSCHLIGAFDKVTSLLRSTKRKMKELNAGGNYMHVADFIKLISLQLPAEPKGKKAIKNLRSVKNRFLLNNQGNYGMLEYLDVELIK